MTTDTQTIALNKLFHSDANVRHTGKADGIEGLAASIAAHGLRQNLNVAPREDGKGFEVVAGGRRLRALKHLAKTGQIATNASISCRVLGEGDDPAEISLVENAMREAMHPDDQCAAFADLIAKGSTVEEVAARFGVTPAVVRQRLKLAGVSADDLLAWCLSHPQDVLLDLLAFVAALTVDAVESKGTGRKPAADALAQAVTPTCSRAGGAR